GADGVLIEGEDLGAANRVQGNLIGTDVTGTRALGNAGSGVVVSFTPDTTVGGTAAGAGNVISGNNENGVRVDGAARAVVQGNFIGTDGTGTRNLANGSDGVLIFRTGSGNQIGGTAPAAGNVIGFNGGAGVNIKKGPNAGLGNPINNAILGNAIFVNAGLGID